MTLLDVVLAASGPSMHAWSAWCPPCAEMTGQSPATPPCVAWDWSGDSSGAMLVGGGLGAAAAALASQAAPVILVAAILGAVVGMVARAHMQGIVRCSLQVLGGPAGSAA